MKTINCTPHPVNICDENGTTLRIIEPNGTPIRLASRTVPAGEHDGIPLSRTEFGEPVGLPEPEEGTLFIVSQIVKNALPERRDLLVPAEVVRNGNGVIMGCRSLGI